MVQSQIRVSKWIVSFFCSLYNIYVLNQNLDDFELKYNHLSTSSSLHCVSLGGSLIFLLYRTHIALRMVILEQLLMRIVNVINRVFYLSKRVMWYFEEGGMVL